MVFSSLAEFEKWHKSIQRRCNASQLRKPQTGATLPPFRCDITKGPRHQTKKQKGPHFDIPSGIKSGSNPSVSPSKERE